MKKIFLFLLPILILSQEAGHKRNRQGNPLSTHVLTTNPAYKNLKDLERLPLRDIVRVLQQPNQISRLKSKHGVFLSNAYRRWLRFGAISPACGHFTIASHVGPKVFVPDGPVRTNSDFSLLLTNTIRHALTGNNLHFTTGLPENAAGLEQPERPNLTKSFLFLDPKGNATRAKMNISNRLCRMLVDGFNPDEQKSIYDLHQIKDNLEDAVFILNKKSDVRLAVKGDNDPCTHYLSAAINPQRKTVDFVVEHSFINFEDTEGEVANLPFKISPSGHLMFVQSAQHPFLSYRLNAVIMSLNVEEYKRYRALQLTNTNCWYLNNPEVVNRNISPTDHCTELLLSDYIDNIGRYDLGSDIILSSNAVHHGTALAILTLNTSGNKSLKVLKEDTSQPESIAAINIGSHLKPEFVNTINKIRISNDEKRLLAVTGKKEFSVLELEPKTHKPVASREYHVGENTINKVWLHEDGKSVLIHAQKPSGSNFVSRVDIG